MGLRGKGIPEEEEKVDLLLNDHSPDLLITTQGAREAALYGQARLFFKERSGSPGCVKIMLSEYVAVFFDPIAHLSLFGVMRDEGDALLCGERRKGVVEGDDAHNKLNLTRWCGIWKG